MSPEQRQAEALARLFSFYDAIELAAAIDDVDQIAWLVAARADIVDELVQASREAPLSPAMKDEIALLEQGLHLTLVRLHDVLFQSLTAQRRRAHAVTRYATHN